MPPDKIKIREFRSLDEFRAWWKSPEVVQFKKSYPEKVGLLLAHRWVKPWLKQGPGETVPSAPPQTATNTFGRYRIEKELGKGGMGAVYLAYDPMLKRKVALKVILTQDQESRERFLREAQAVAKLKHPNIVQVYDVGIVGKQHYFTMDYIEGGSLDDKMIGLKKGRLHPRQATEIIRDIALALHYAHSQGIIHRDIKPANILMDSDGRPYLTDFGLAKELKGLDRSLTLSGSLIGTAEYMSPEQAMGEKHKIDHRSDVFSLGSTLYRSLTGHLPFEGEKLYEILSKVVNKDPIPLSRLVRTIPRDLETICLKCLEKDKPGRYQTTKALADDLSRYLEGDVILARPRGFVTRVWKKAKKNKIVSLAILSVAVILMAVVIALAISSARTAQERAEKERAEAKAVQEQAEKEQAEARADKERAGKEQAEARADKEQAGKEQAEARADKERAGKERAEIVAEKAHKEKRQLETASELRNQAKVVLDRTTGARTPEEKIRIAQEALKIDPSFGRAYQVIGYAYKEKGDNDKAFEYFTKAIEATPTLAYSWYERAMITAFIRNKLEEAIPDFEKVLKYDPNSHIGYLAKGTIELHQRNYDKAILSFTRAIELYPDYDLAYANRGIAYMEKGDLDQAMADYNKAIELNPKFALAYSNRGLAYKDKGDLDQAMADYNKAIEVNPKLAGAYTNRGTAYYKKGNLDRAIADYNKAIELNPKLAEAYTNRGLAYADKGNSDRAIADHNKAIEINPKYAGAYANRGSAYHQKGDLDRAIADFNKAIELNPRFAQAYTNRGLAYVVKGDLDRAIADYNRAIELDPRYAVAYSNRGIVYKNKGDWDRAIADLNKAIELNPRYAGDYSARGFIYLNKGDFDRVIADCSKAIGLNPKLAEPYANRGSAYAQKGDYKAAIADGERFLRLAPNSPYAPKIRQLIEEWKKKEGGK